MTEIYEENFKVVSKYVHATSRGHEVIQTAVGMQLQPQDYMFPYYRDDAMLLSIGMSPYELMLQVLAKKTIRFRQVVPITRILVYATTINLKFRIKVVLPVCKQYLQRVLPWGFGTRRLKE
ncbi:unnamed protein product [Pylaiella littoralis]